MWPNSDRYGVGLSRGHRGKCLWAFDWHPGGHLHVGPTGFLLASLDLTFDDLEGSKIKSVILCDVKYVKNRTARVTMLDPIRYA